MPADWASSLTAHSGHERLAPQRRALWDDPARGTVPISWSTSPLILDAGRHMLNHYRRTATPNDYLLAGPTGAGYVFPEPFPDDSFRRSRGSRATTCAPPT